MRDGPRLPGDCLSEIVVVEPDWLIAQVEPAAVLVFPAVLAQTDTDDRVLGVALDEPLLVTLVDAVTSKAACCPVELDALIALRVHCADFNGLVADDLDNLVGVDVRVAVVVCVVHGVSFSYPARLL